MGRHKHCFERAKPKLLARLAIGAQETIDDRNPLRDSRMRAGQVDMEERREAVADLVGEGTRLLELDQHKNEASLEVKNYSAYGVIDLPTTQIFRLLPTIQTLRD
jgi:hypothetical protein